MYISQYTVPKPNTNLHRWYMVEQIMYKKNFRTIRGYLFVHWLSYR